ncbi:hypothetical protein PT313_00730 [Metamycoplasma hyosynoviae]|uniref:OppA family ABC transporter substrate-binding lipoprotein n=1 Tax=Metamycoplasma hyosynoviae TaxID=29559 RepID=UPI00235E2DBF|nr:hypothetical protein [Metamycoplasma hyosynoviae]MDD1374123.1 hypothetical protein [Metamycoplasma hyosynoviae]MDD1378762.1 hypothetical protein [Metamycoplasma hyosynoviae]
MTKKQKLLFLNVIPLTALTGIPLISASCEKDIIQRQQFVRAWNSLLTPVPFRGDGSRSYGSFQETTMTHNTGGLLLRVQGLNEPEVKDGREIISPTFAKYRLELASAIVLTLEDGSVKTYDNDKAEVTPQKPTEGWEKITVFKESNNATSINNKQFFEDLKKTKKLQFAIKEGVHWVDYKGRKTSYQVVPKDFYYSWLRTVNINQEERIKNGTSEEIDKIMNEKLVNKDTSIFTSNQAYSNEYLYGLFDVDSSKFYKEESFIQALPNSTKQGVTFELTPGGKVGSFEAFLQKCVIGNYDFLAAPSQFIEETNKDLNKLTIYNHLNKKLSSADEKLVRDKLVSIKDTLYGKIGSYWYGLGDYHTLHVGPFYEAFPTGTTRVFKENTYYWDKDWVNSKRKVKEVVWKYNQSAGTDKKQFARTQFNNFKLNEVSTVAYDTLESNEKAEIIKKNLGPKYTKTLNKFAPTYKFVSVPLVRGGKDKYLFNDAYAKLVYGATIEEIKNGKQKIDNYIGGLGLSFRTILDAAVNWATFEDEQSNGIWKPWLGKLAKDGQIGGSDQLTASKKTLDEFYEDLNSLYAIDKDGNRIKFDGEKTLITNAENIQWAKSQKEIKEKLKSAQFAKLKEKLAETIQKFDQENPQYKDQKFEYTYYFQYLNIRSELKSIEEKLMKLFTELNDRLNIKFEYSSQEDEMFNNVRDNGISGQEFAGWGYDYDGSASGFDGMSWSQHLIFSLTWINAKASESFKKSFPELVKLASGLKTYQTTNTFKSSIPFDELYLISNRYAYTFNLGGYNYKFKKDNDLYVLERDTNNKPIPYPEATDIYLWSAKFWFNHIKTLKNEDVVKLLQEIITFQSIDHQLGGNHINKNPFTPYLINKAYSYPIVSGEVEYQSDIWIKK